MPNKVGFHIMDGGAAMDAWIPKYKSAVHLMLAINVGGEVPQTAHLAANNPNSRIIYRAWSYGGVGMSDHFDWYLDQHGTDITPLLEAHEPVFQTLSQYKNVSYQIFNETGHDEHLWPHFIEVNKKWVQALDARGLSASTLGMGPGHPARANREELRKAWFIARPLFEAINAARQTHLINLHEYHAVPFTRFVPWVIGRYKMMLEDVAAMGLLTPKIQVVIGESGFTDPNALGFPSPAGPNGIDWSLSQGHSTQDLVNDYMAMIRQEYDPNPNLLGLCYFGFGNGVGWLDFDLRGHPGMLEGFYAQLNHNPSSGGNPVPEPIFVTDTPNTEYEVVADSLRVRRDPSLAAAQTGSLTKGQRVVTNGAAENNGYRWRRLAGGGFSAELLLNDPANPLMQKYVEQPQEPEEPAWKVEALAKLAQIEAQAQEVRVLLEQA